MNSKRTRIPDGMAQYALELFGDLGVNVATRFDPDGRSVELLVPYDLGQNRMARYRISRRNDDVVAELLGPRIKRCYVTDAEKDTFRELFRRIDASAYQVPEPKGGPHNLRICT